jgi:hypothetical protein
MKHNQRPRVDIGLMAMPVFCCLLAAILILILSSGSGHRPPLAPEKVRELLARITQARLVIAQSDLAQHAVSNRLDLAEYRHATKKLEAELEEKLLQAAKLSNQVSQAQIVQGRLEEKQRQAQTTQADVEAARSRIQELESRIKAATTNDAIGLFGTYRGSLVLVECDSQGAMIHPSGRRLTATAPERELDSVIDDIKRAGFVAIVARPDGFTKSYDRFHRLILDRLEDLNRLRSTPIGFCAFPLTDDASIAAFLPKGGLK